MRGDPGGRAQRQRQTIQSLRDLSFNIEPVVLRDQGFVPAVRALAERVGLDETVEVDVDVAPGEAFAERAQVAFYQLIRVALDQAAGRRPSRSRSRSRDSDDGGAALRSSTTGIRAATRDGAEAFEERARPLSGRVEVERARPGRPSRSSPRAMRFGARIGSRGLSRFRLGAERLRARRAGRRPAGGRRRGRRRTAAG